MLTLNGTQSTNNQVNWMIRLYAQGSNLVTLGDFSASTGWTLSGDWAIGSGVATYNYVDDAAGIIYRDITAVTASSYILEYEVTNTDTTAGAYSFVLLGGGAYIVSDNIALDFSLGKHSISIKGVATKTRLGLQLGGAAATTELSIDNVTLRLAEVTTSIATEDITLDSAFDGKTLSNNGPISPMVWNSTIPSSGGTGTVTSYSINISRYITNTNLDGFFNEFYPATDGGVLMGKIIDLGICWKDSASADTDVTWLLRGRIVEYSYTPRDMQLIIFQQSEITNKEVPYYSIQKDFNNGVSYYTKAPKENYGVVIPIVYGSFDKTSLSLDIKQLCASPCVDKTHLTFIQASHKLYSQNHPGYTDSLFKYISDLDTYMILIPDNGQSINYNHVSTVQLYSPSRVASESIYGTLYLVPKGVGITSDINDIEDILNDTDSTYVVVSDADELGLKFGSASSTGIGTLGQSAGDIKFYVEWQSTNGAQRQIGLRGYNEALSSPAYVNLATENTTLTGAGWESTELSLGNYTTNKSNTNLPWTIEELCNMSYVSINNSGAGGAVSGDINIRVAFLLLTNIIVVGTFKKNNNVRPMDGAGGYL